MCIFFQTIHPVEFPEGNPIQQGWEVSAARSLPMPFGLESFDLEALDRLRAERIQFPKSVGLRNADGPPWCDRDLLTCHCCYGLASATGF